MTGRLLKGLAVAAILALPRLVSAQYAASQDSTLRDLKLVYVNFSDPNRVLEQAQAARVAASAILELRKAGLKVAKDASELDLTRDAILNISLLATGSSWNENLSLRMDIEQRAQLVRTQRVLQMVTWYHESTSYSVRPRDVAPGVVVTGINHFLTKWLDQNDR